MKRPLFSFTLSGSLFERILSLGSLPRHPPVHPGLAMEAASAGAPGGKGVLRPLLASQPAPPADREGGSSPCRFGWREVRGAAAAGAGSLEVARLLQIGYGLLLHRWTTLRKKHCASASVETTVTHLTLPYLVYLYDVRSLLIML